MLFTFDSNTPRLFHPVSPDGSQSQVLDKRNEVPIGKQLGVSLFDAECSDDDVGGFAGGDAPFSECPIILHVFVRLSGAEQVING